MYCGDAGGLIPIYWPRCGPRSLSEHCSPWHELLCDENICCAGSQYRLMTLKTCRPGTPIERSLTFYLMPAGYCELMPAPICCRRPPTLPCFVSAFRRTPERRRSPFDGALINCPKGRPRGAPAIPAAGLCAGNIGHLPWSPDVSTLLISFSCDEPDDITFTLSEAPEAPEHTIQSGFGMTGSLPAISSVL